MKRVLWYSFFFLFSIFLTVSCVDTKTIRPIHAKDFYQRGLDFLSNKAYPEALKDFSQCIKIADPITEEYYASMCYFEKAFTYSLQGRNKPALQEIEVLLAQVVSSKEPRVLAENLRTKILAGKSYQNATY